MASPRRGGKHLKGVHHVSNGALCSLQDPAQKWLVDIPCWPQAFSEADSCRAVPTPSYSPCCFEPWTWMEGPRSHPLHCLDSPENVKMTRLGQTCPKFGSRWCSHLQPLHVRWRNGASGRMLLFVALSWSPKIIRLPLPNQRHKLSECSLLLSLFCSILYEKQCTWACCLLVHRLPGDRRKKQMAYN